jgi:hypothetical protein
MDFLYNEIEPESEKLVRAHLQSCPACRHEYEALSRTSLTLKAWENEDPRLHLVFVQENKSWLGVLTEKLFRNSSPAWGRLAGLSAGIAIGVLFISALLNTEISFNNGSFTYRTSLLPRPSATVDSQLVAQMQQQLDEKYEQLLLASQQQQRDEFNHRLAKFVSEIDRQRQNDLMLVGRGLDEFQQQNHALINQFLQSVKSPPQR